MSHAPDTGNETTGEACCGHHDDEPPSTFNREPVIPPPASLASSTAMAATSLPSTEETEMMRPHRFASMYGSTRRVAQNVLLRFHARAFAQASSDSSWIRAKPSDPPALLTRMSTPPK